MEDQGFVGNEVPKSFGMREPQALQVAPLSVSTKFKVMVAKAKQAQSQENQSADDQVMPIILQDLEQSRQRMEDLHSRLGVVTDQLGQAPPEYKPGQPTQSDLLAALIVGHAGGANHALNTAYSNANQQGQIDYQNKSNAYQANHESLLRQFGMLSGEQNQEAGNQGDLQKMQVNQLNIEGAQKETRVQKAWDAYNKAATLPQMQTAAKRLHSLDPEFAPDEESIGQDFQGRIVKTVHADASDFQKAIREASLDGIVSDQDASSLEQYAQSIAKAHGYDRSQLPAVHSFTTVQKAAQGIKEKEWAAHFNFTKDKWAKQVSEHEANYQLAKQRLQVAKDALAQGLYLGQGSLDLRNQGMQLQQYDAQIEALNAQARLAAKEYGSEQNISKMEATVNGYTQALKHIPKTRPMQDANGNIVQGENPEYSKAQQKLDFAQGQLDSMRAASGNTGPSIRSSGYPSPSDVPPPPGFTPLRLSGPIGLQKPNPKKAKKKK